MGDAGRRRDVDFLFIPCVACVALTTMAELFELYCAEVKGVGEQERALLRDVFKHAFYAGAAAMLDALDLDTCQDPDHQRLEDEIEAFVSRTSL